MKHAAVYCNIVTYKEVQPPVELQRTFANLRLKLSTTVYYNCNIQGGRVSASRVAVPSLSIEGSPSILASAGSNITLRCRISPRNIHTPIQW